MSLAAEGRNVATRLSEKPLVHPTAIVTDSAWKISAISLTVARHRSVWSTREAVPSVNFRHTKR